MPTSAKNIARLKTMRKNYCRFCRGTELLPSRTQPFLVRLFWLLFLCRVFRCQACHTAQIVFLPLYWLN